MHTNTYLIQRQMIITAIEKGFGSIGFSEHSQTSSPASLKSGEATRNYKQKIADLKEKYKGQIDVYCGLKVVEID